VSGSGESCATEALQPARCLLCEGSQFTALFEGSHRLLLCRRCALVFLAGPPRDLYDYYRHHYEFGIADHPAGPERVVRWIVRHLPAERDPRVLEIGCGGGQLLVRLRERGFRVWGAEPGERGAARARDAHGLSVTRATLEDLAASPPGERYDGVLMIQTFEHLPDPLRALTLVRGLLADEGLLLLEVPHLFSPTGLYPWRMNGRALPSANHLFVYSAGTLQAFLQRAGFEVVHSGRTLTNLRMVARRTVAARAGRPSAGAYWKARAFHGLMPLLLPTVDAARTARELLREVMRRDGVS
jgi:SAM-dependent methyltransferase